VRTNADQRGPSRTNTDRHRAPLAPLIRDALPLLLRDRVVDAVLAAQTALGAPVTSREARDALLVMRTPRAFTEVAQAISKLGPDERGRELCFAGTDRNGFALWWVKEQAP
jgi:hypothetical protein